MTLTDLYAQLFGKGAIRDGDVIAMAEHGRAGGISTGQPLKHVAIPPLSVRQATNASLTFYGFSKPGTNATLPNWRIMAEDAYGNIYFADGDDNFDNIWSNFGSYVLS